ncbi:26S proteasome regulatory subunit N5 [Pancytospora philotis]|nr:26S proteasome regulatory subunit N5 [Pancytospora philotis]
MDQLFEEERRARIEGNTDNLMAIQQQIIGTCRTDEEIISALRSLSNKKRQDPACIKRLIRDLIAGNKDVPFYRRLLCDVIESKIYLEEERLTIAEHIKAMLGDDEAAAYETLRDIPVETFTTISDKRRNAFLFEQFRLSLLLRLYTEAELVSRRVRRNCLENTEKVVFYNYCMILRIGQRAFLKAASLLLDLNEVDPTGKNMISASFFAILSNSFIERTSVKLLKQELLSKCVKSKENNPTMRAFLAKFSSSGILRLSLADEILHEICRFEDVESLLQSNGGLDFYRQQLHHSIVEHNFAIVGRYVTKISINQLASVLSLSEDAVVEYISEMVNEKYADIKINQQSGLVSFGAKSPNTSADAVLDQIVKVCHLIHQDSISNAN